MKLLKATASQLSNWYNNNIYYKIKSHSVEKILRMLIILPEHSTYYCKENNDCTKFATQAWNHELE